MTAAYSEAMPILSRSVAFLALALSTTACSGMLKIGGGTSSGSSTGAGSAPVSSGGGRSAGDIGAVPAAATPATKFSDFAFAVKEATGEYYTGWIIDKLTTFNVAPACMEKMVDGEKFSAVHSASYYTRDVARLAQKLTGDDWSGIESQNNSDRENNKKLVEPMIDQFANHFHMTITVEGDDCDARHSSLWMKYWTSTSTALLNYPPETDKVFINLVVKPDAKDMSVSFDDATATYTIVGPRDIEKGAWGDKIDKAMKRRARGK